MPVKYAYLYCLSNNAIGDLLKIGVVNVPFNDRRRLSEILEETMGTTWQFEMAKLIHQPQSLAITIQNILKLHYPVVERNIFNMPLEDAYMYFELVRGTSVQLAHCKRTDH
jgi:hypothetical protein